MFAHGLFVAAIRRQERLSARLVVLRMTWLHSQLVTLTYVVHLVQREVLVAVRVVVDARPECAIVIVQQTLKIITDLLNLRREPDLRRLMV